MISKGKFNKIAISIVFIVITVGCAPQYVFFDFKNLSPKQRGQLDSLEHVLNQYKKHQEDQTVETEIQAGIYSLYDIEDSLSHVKYDHIDTLGAQQRFFTALCPQLAQAVVSNIHCDNYERVVTAIEINIFRLTKKAKEVFFSIAPATIYPDDMDDGDGYLMYNGTVLVKVRYTKRHDASKIIDLSLLKRTPYNKFKFTYRYTVASYDGSSDLYRITNRGTIEFIGRGFLDENFILHSTNNAEEIIEIGK